MTETKRPTNPDAEQLLNLYFPVLDHGFVALKDYMGTDQCIEEAARVSYQAGTRKVNQTRGLLRYLKSHDHSSPYEQVELKFHMSMPLFVARQIVRTRTANLNEMSGRYSLLPMLFYTPESEHFNKQSATNNQGRSEEPADNYKMAVKRWNKLRTETQELYEDLVSSEVARELARIDLPLSVYTQWYWKIDLHNLLHFLTLRADPHAQWETRQYANIMAGIVKMVAPISFEAWLDFDFCGAKMSRLELETLRSILYVNDTVGCIETNKELFPFVEINLKKRDLTEFLNKLKPKQIHDFTLDLSRAKTGEYFEEKISAAVSKIDK